MRLRKKPGTIDKVLEEKELIITEPVSLKGKWQDIYQKSAPLALEIGMGGGRFLTELAKRNPQFNYLGIERKEALLLFAAEKIKAFNLSNIKLLWFDANKLTEIFGDNEITELYLNFSDPWPKNRHAKRRLTYKGYLEKYATILKPGGKLEFKTDNQELFEFSLNEFLHSNFRLNTVAFDLHSKDYFNEVTTEYEERFTKLGQKIFYLQAENGC